MISRFAPSTTGEAHPGTLLAALLVWLDARARHGQALLRLEDLDITRTKAAWSEQMIEACAWLGLTWDAVVVQSDRRAAHDAALDLLAASGRLYPCSCSRADRIGGRRAPDGSWAYANACRGRPLPPGGWRASHDAIRVQLDDDRIELVDAGGLELSQTPALEQGDPIVRRRDGVIAYQLAVVVDDHDAAITDVVRGRDIAPSTATQIMLQRLLGMATPRYRHHFLLVHPVGRLEAAPLHLGPVGRLEAAPVHLGPVGRLEAAPLHLGPGAGKLAKLHGSIPFSALHARHDGPTLCGRLAHAANLIAAPAPCTPHELVAGFDWARVPHDDRIAWWDERGLTITSA